MSMRSLDHLRDCATISALDEAIPSSPEKNQLFLDLRDTPSGGNATIARAIMGCFVGEARDYQGHERPAELRETGTARQWVEQVLPREKKHRFQLPTLLVGRWTGSMGEGRAIGFAALGAEVRGTRMAGVKHRSRTRIRLHQDADDHRWCLPAIGSRPVDPAQRHVGTSAARLLARHGNECTARRDEDPIHPGQACLHT